MKRLAWLILMCAAGAPYALADDAAALAVLRAGCTADAQKFCANVPAGGGRVIACLKANKDALSDQCKQAAAKAAAMNGSGPSSTATTAAGGMPDSSTALPAPAIAAPAPSAAPAAKPSRRNGASSGAAPGSYLLMKKVQITDQSTAQTPQPAYDLLIPSTWQLKGGVTFGGGKGGCFSDLMAVSWEASDPDGSRLFQGGPNYTWQYSTDPTELRKLNDPLRRQLGAGGKPCPVSKPVKAEEYFRQSVVPNLASATVVSVEPFAELNQLVHQQLGLAATDGGNGPVRTDAIRARITSQKDGKPVESWVSLAVVCRVFPVGQGGFWNCQAIDFMAFVASPGKLDANDKLYKVMVTSVRPVPQWQAHANSIIAKFSQAEAQKEAQQDQIIADFQRKVAQTIMETTANAQRGSMQSSFGFDQNIRGVQTFRDPTTGKTMELSNQYDHAWLNGNNEYVMSDDPSFNPNSQLNGSWNQLQVVRPSP